MASSSTSGCALVVFGSSYEDLGSVSQIHPVVLTPCIVQSSPVKAQDLQNHSDSQRPHHAAMLRSPGHRCSRLPRDVPALALPPVVSTEQRMSIFTSTHCLLMLQEKIPRKQLLIQVLHVP